MALGLPSSESLSILAASRIAQAYNSCHLVKGLACRIISCASQYLASVVVCNLNDIGMSSRNHQRRKRRLKFFVLYICSRNMTLYMMNAYEGFVPRQRQRLCRRYPYKQGSHKSGASRLLLWRLYRLW